MSKYVYAFGGGRADGNESMKNLLGGKRSEAAQSTLTFGTPLDSFTGIRSAFRLSGPGRMTSLTLASTSSIASSIAHPCPQRAQGLRTSPT